MNKKREPSPGSSSSSSTNSHYRKRPPTRHSHKPESNSDVERKYQPENAAESPKKPKGLCQCESCEFYVKDVSLAPFRETQFQTNDSAKKCIKKYEPLIKTAQYPGKTPNIIKHHFDDMTKIQKQSTIRFLVHSELNPPKPVSLVTETYFPSKIQSVLSQLNYSSSKSVQPFVWPSIFRQMDVFMIDKPYSGKTLSYLPVMCSFALEKDDKYAEFAKYKGPLIIILCPNSEKCAKIYDLAMKINNERSYKVSNFTAPFKESRIDILVTMPKVLIECIKRRIFNLKRLCHLVFEDASAMLEMNSQQIFKILSSCNEMLDHRANNRRVQLIVSSSTWSNQLKNLLQLVYFTPIVCIADHLEAALYGGIEFELKFAHVDTKRCYLLDMLVDKYATNRTIIVCGSDEITELNKFLARNGIDTIHISDSDSKEETIEKEDAWHCSQLGDFQVLLCTDFILDKFLTIDECQQLVHYSIPNRWSDFGRRFSCMLKSFNSPLENRQGSVEPKSIIFVDETNEKHLERILDLVLRLDSPPELFELKIALQNEFERKKTEKNIDLCPDIKLFGKCDEWMCPNRHTIKNNSIYPKNGKIVFKIVQMEDVTRFMVQLLKRIDFEGNEMEFYVDNIDESLDYCNAPKMKALNVELGQFYALVEHSATNDIYKLCYCIKLGKGYVEVQCVGSNQKMVVPQSSLYLLPKQLAIVEVFLCNLVPKYEDTIFATRAFNNIRRKLEENNYKRLIFTADICLHVENTFWVNNVIESVNVDQMELIKFKMENLLKDEQVVDYNSKQINRLYALCIRSGIDLPDFNKLEVRKAIAKMCEIRVHRAFLPDDEISEVFFSSAVDPGEFYVRLAKFQDLLQNLEKDIASAINNAEIPPLNHPIEIGHFYLAIMDEKNASYSRVLILEKDATNVLCFHVDYGDETIIKHDQIITLPINFITKLPFQAIQCSLAEIEPLNSTKWQNGATDLLYEHLLEPNSDFFRLLHAKLVQKVKSPTNRTDFRYEIMLKDDEGLINAKLVEKGYASSDTSLVDFECGARKVANYDFAENLREDEEFLAFGDFELVIDDPVKCLEALFSKQEQIQAPKLRAIEAVKEQTVKEQVPVVNGDGFLTPEVYWSQSAAKVWLKIKLSDVRDFRVGIVRNMAFNFSASLGEKRYVLKWTLFRLAKVEQSVAFGQEVRVTLAKVREEEWEQLTSGARWRNVHYEINGREEKEVRRRIFDLGIKDDEEESDEEEDRVLRICDSDQDSEFDRELSELEDDE